MQNSSPTIDQPDTATESGTLLDIRDLRTHFETEDGVVAAVDGVSWSVPRGRTVALVGESGCGKSVTALSLLQLIPQPPGRIVSGSAEFRPSRDGPGQDLLRVSEQELRRIRGRQIAMIFQDPMASLNPVFSIGEQIVETIRVHMQASKRAAWERAVDLLARVGIPDPRRRVHEYPHQMSGGMQQRAMIAMALSCDPILLIADEPTTALDVTVQAQILELLRKLQYDTGMSVLMITHDLGVVAQIADEVCVMYAGRIVERADVRTLFTKPLHPYTQGLLKCIPRLSRRERTLPVIPGTVADPKHPPRGCRFHPRCQLTAQRASDNTREKTTAAEAGQDHLVLRRCVQPASDLAGGQPDLRDVGAGHLVACWEAEGYA